MRRPQLEGWQQWMRLRQVFRAAPRTLRRSLRHGACFRCGMPTVDEVLFVLCELMAETPQSLKLGEAMALRLEALRRVSISSVAPSSSPSRRRP